MRLMAKILLLTILFLVTSCSSPTSLEDAEPQPRPAASEVEAGVLPASPSAAPPKPTATNRPDEGIRTEIPTPLPIDPAEYQGWWTYTHDDYGFSLMLPEDWLVEEITTNDALMNGHLLNIYPEAGIGGLNIRLSFRRSGEEQPLWPTGVGAGEFIQQGTLEVAGQPVKRTLFVCPTGEINSIWYQGEQEPNIVRGDLEFGFLFSYTDVYCQEGYSLGGKEQHVGELVIASLGVE